MRKALGLMLLALPVAAAANVKEGQWEYRSEMHIPGMQMPELPPDVQLPPASAWAAAGW